MGWPLEEPWATDAGDLLAIAIEAQVKGKDVVGLADHVVMQPDRALRTGDHGHAQGAPRLDRAAERRDDPGGGRVVDGLVEQQAGPAVAEDPPDDLVDVFGPRGLRIRPEQDAGGPLREGLGELPGRVDRHGPGQGLFVLRIDDHEVALAVKQGAGQGALARPGPTDDQDPVGRLDGETRHRSAGQLVNPPDRPIRMPWMPRTVAGRAAAAAGEGDPPATAGRGADRVATDRDAAPGDGHWRTRIVGRLPSTQTDAGGSSAQA